MAQRPFGLPFAMRSTTVAARGMVAAAHPLAVEVGLDMLRRGGSAVDAAVAANAVLALVEPTACGLGGDLFAMVRTVRGGELRGLDASGRAPAGIEISRVRPTCDGTIPLFSPDAWTVPGCVDGWSMLHRRFGRLGLAELLEPAVEYARRGAPIPLVIAGSWERASAVMQKMPGFGKVFLPGGRAPREGELFRNLALARTLERIGRDGRDAFYDGPIAEEIVRFSKQHGGHFARSDLRGHRGQWVEPLKTSYRGVTVWELPPAGQGLAALQMLNVMEGFDLSELGRGSPDYWHLLVESKKLVYEDRARYYADPLAATVPVEELLSKEHADRLRRRIRPDRAAAPARPDVAALGQGDTTYLAAADARGMMVSLIQSNYTGFGSGYVIPRLGFGLQNRGALFSLRRSHPNALRSGKRPFHTIIPAFLGQKGQPDTAFGVMGGDMQPQGHAQIVSNLVDFGMDLQAAGDAPRFHHAGSSEPTGVAARDEGVLHLEPGVSSRVRRELRRRGHRIVPCSAVVFGGYQAIRRNHETGVYLGATESRKDGLAGGF